MIKINKKLKFFIALIILIISILVTNVYAIENPGFYEPDGPSTQDAGSFLNKAGTVIGLVKNVGIIVSIVALSIIGLKYMFSSVEGKAEYKKTMFPYVIGCAMLMCTSMIVGIILEITKA